jgi:RNA polymerase sigma factor (sigma-70 family)
MFTRPCEDGDARARKSEDRELALRVAAGDRAALAYVYELYSDRIFDFCYSMLHDRDEAADAAQEVFLVALEKICMLREPDKMKPWLFAVARNDCLRRIRKRAKLSPNSDALETISSDSPLEEDTNPDALRELVWSAAAGLVPRDRALLDLHVRQGLNGQELADVVGTKRSRVYVMVNRLKAQFEMAMNALLVTRYGRESCTELQRILAGSGDAFTPLVRKRVTRHVETCETCEETKQRVASPMALLSALPIVAAPMSLKERLFRHEAGESGVSPRPVSKTPRFSARNGFPKTLEMEPTPSVPVAVAVVAFFAATGGVAITASQSSSPQPAHTSALRTPHHTNSRRDKASSPSDHIAHSVKSSDAQAGSGTTQLSTASGSSIITKGAAPVSPLRIPAEGTPTSGSLTPTTTLPIAPTTTPPNCAFSATQYVGLAPTSTDRGYWTVNSLGQVTAYGDARPEVAIPIRDAPIVSIASVSGSITSYYLLAEDGTIVPVGGAPFYGDPKNLLSQPICDAVAIATTPDGRGYWVVTSAGDVFAFGDAVKYGAPSVPPATIVGFVPTPDGEGYWELAHDGIYAFGNAGAYCSVPAHMPIAAIAATPDNQGCWMVASDGGLFVGGDAENFGSGTSTAPIVAIADYSSGGASNQGYWLLSASGAVHAYGSAHSYPPR